MFALPLCTSVQASRADIRQGQHRCQLHPTFSAGQFWSISQRKYVSPIKEIKLKILAENVVKFLVSWYAMPSAISIRAGSNRWQFVAVQCRHSTSPISSACKGGVTVWMVGESRNKKRRCDSVVGGRGPNSKQS